MHAPELHPKNANGLQHGLIAFLCLVGGAFALGIPLILQVNSRGLGSLFLIISTVLCLYGIISSIRAFNSPREKGIVQIVLILLLIFGGILSFVWWIFFSGSHGFSPYM